MPRISLTYFPALNENLFYYSDFFYSGEKVKATHVKSEFRVITKFLLTLFLEPAITISTTLFKLFF